MNKAKIVLERLEAMQNRGMSGMAILAELQELIDLAPAAVQEVYQAETDLEQANELLSVYERGHVA